MDESPETSDSLYNVVRTLYIRLNVRQLKLAQIPKSILLNANFNIILLFTILKFLN